ncbi:M67 family metallopeptidase [bacterium]|nr:M67 family metallopeptidase [bacterium]MBT3794853.1 M67 family metallopeptidase [bacterium]MBT4634300.1 M67 family metallopeptidase [bacterium]
MVKISLETNNQLVDISEKGFPYEVCGFLLGEIRYGEKESDGMDNEFDIKEILVCENINKETPEIRFEMKEGEYEHAEVVAKDKGLRIIGIYHSHPDHKSYASPTDNLYAQPDTIYLIYSIMNAKFNELKGYILNTKDWELQEIKIETT